MPRRASRQELPSISNEMECTCCAGKATLRKEDFMEKKARLDGILMGEEERRKRFYRSKSVLRNRYFNESVAAEFSDNPLGVVEHFVAAAAGNLHV